MKKLIFGLMALTVSCFASCGGFSNGTSCGSDSTFVDEDSVFADTVAVDSTVLDTIEFQEADSI